jgi:DNA-binding transcriptional LysR family regulator
MSQNHRYKEIQLAQLRSFCLAATEGNFTRAARALGLSASTVWQQVRALERELKAKLLRRRGRAVELTDEGRLLLEVVQPHVSGLDSLRHFFEVRREGIRQELVVASGAYLLANHLPGPIGQFRARRPSIQLTLRIAAWSALQRVVERGETDVGVLACDPDVPRSPFLDYEHLFDEQFSLMLPVGHPLLRAKRITPHDLVKYPLILPPKGGADRKALDRVLRTHNLTDRVQTALVCGLVDVAKKYVTLGVGIAPMYVTQEVAQCTPGLRVRPLDPEMERLPIEMAVRKGTHLPGYVDEFRQVVRQFLSEESKSAKS